MQLKRSLCFFIFSFQKILFSHTYFPAEKLAVQLNLPSLAKESLEAHALDIFPKGLECRLLLAQIAYLQKNFRAMFYHLEHLPDNLSTAYLKALYNWFDKQKIVLTPLLFAKQSHPLGQFLSACNTVLFEPNGSIRLAQFLSQQSSYYASKQFEQLRQMLFEMKLLLEPGSLGNHQDPVIWQAIAIQLLIRKQFDTLKEFLKRTIPLLNDTTDQTRCLLWLLRVKRSLNENCDDIISNYLINVPGNINHFDIILSEWMQSISDPQQKLKLLKQFYKIYKDQKLTFHMYYVQLLQADCLVTLKQLDVAKEMIENIIHLNLEPALQLQAYEISAKIALSVKPANYRAAAYYLAEASRYSSNLYEQLLYSKLQGECYCLLSEYQRAYCIYKEALKKAAGPIALSLAEEWCLCGILCDKDAEELEQQLAFCRLSHFLTIWQMQTIRLAFANRRLEKNQFEAALRYLQSHDFSEPHSEYSKLLQGKCLFRLGNYQHASKILSSISLDDLPKKDVADYFLWQTYTENELNNKELTQLYLKKFFNVQGIIPMDLQAQAVLLQAEIFAKQHDLTSAKQILLDFSKKATTEWQPFLLFQAGCYAEQNSQDGGKAAIEIFQTLYDMQPQHSLARDGRLKQGLLLMKFNKTTVAQTIFKHLLPYLKDIQALWCRYLIQKCRLITDENSIEFSQIQLEQLLQETMPLTLRLEIVLQLAFVYRQQGYLNKMQKLLWNECYPLLDEERQNFSVNEVYWLNRCMLTLAQHTNDKVVMNQIYLLMAEAQLPGTSIIKQYLDIE